MLKNVHHINLLVRDLDAAMARYQQILGVDQFTIGELSGRGVRTARFRAGETWIVLVQPTDQEGIPARHLEEHGEGLFLLSFEVDSLATAAEAISAGGGVLATGNARQGLDDWQVLDLDLEQFYGAQLQLTEIS